MVSFSREIRENRMANSETYLGIERAVYKGYKQVYRAEREAQSESQWSEPVPRVLAKLTSLTDINRTLNSEVEKLTELEYTIILTYSLKVVLDFEILQDLCLMPPRGCPFELWVCCAGPCKSGYYKKHQDIRKLRELRKRAGIKDDIPENYYNRFEEEWREIWNQEAKKRKEKNSKTDFNTPLFLVPVRDLNDTVKDAIVAIEPGLAPSIDNLFLCSDHFRKNGPRDKRGFNQRRYSSYTAENINKNLSTGEISLSLAKNKHFGCRTHLQSLLKLLSKEPSIDTTPIRKQFDSHQCVSTVVQRLEKMANNFCHRSDAYGNYNHSSAYQQEYSEANGQSSAYCIGYQGNG
jgi:hypothetical protein